jgi:membrane protein YdbS with pleckstrin-like domain
VGVREAPETGVFPREHVALGETILMELKPKKIAFIIGSLFALAFLAIPAILASYSLMTNPGASWRGSGVWLGIAGTVLGLMALGHYLRWRGTFYAVTDRRIISVTGIVGQSVIDVPFDKVQNVMASQGGLQRWLGYGTVVFATAGVGSGARAQAPGIVAGNLIFVGIPKPFEVRRRVEQIVQASTKTAKLTDYRAMAETFREVGAEPMPRVRPRLPAVVLQSNERRPAKFCDFCGAKVEGIPKYCEKCGNRIN